MKEEKKVISNQMTVLRYWSYFTQKERSHLQCAHQAFKYGTRFQIVLPPSSLPSCQGRAQEYSAEMCSNQLDIAQGLGTV